MKSTQAWGWLVAGVMALGLNGFYQDGGAVWAHRAVGQVFASVTDQVEPVLALAAGRADWFAAQTNMLAGREETASCRFATSLARLQTPLLRTSFAQTPLLQGRINRAQGGLARFEALSAREEAAMARMEAGRVRMVEARMTRVRVSSAAFNPAALNPVICPRVRVNVPSVQVSVPMIRVGVGPA